MSSTLVLEFVYGHLAYWVVGVGDRWVVSVVLGVEPDGYYV